MAFTFEKHKRFVLGRWTGDVFGILVCKCSETQRFLSGRRNIRRLGYAAALKTRSDGRRLPQTSGVYAMGVPCKDDALMVTLSWWYG